MPLSFSDKVIDNNRYIRLTFDSKDDYVLHGFAGYFETILFGDVTLSKYNIFYIYQYCSESLHAAPVTQYSEITGLTAPLGFPSAIIRTCMNPT